MGGRQRTSLFMTSEEEERKLGGKISIKEEEKTAKAQQSKKK